MKNFRVKHYEIQSEKVPAGAGIKLALLADQHGVCFGAENEPLLQAIRQENTDAVLLAGDMICRRDLESMRIMEGFLCRLAEEFPVYYGMGNHETYEVKKREDWYIGYERRLRAAGVHCLHNRHAVLSVKGTELHIFGLELPLECFQKPFPAHPTLSSLTKRIGDPSLDGINLLIAHHPMYARTYFLWGADLVVSGHYHGGVLRLSEHCGVLSPQLQIFPAYCCGDFHDGEQHLIVSPGLGEHSVPMRFHNPPELIIITLESKK